MPEFPEELLIMRKVACSKEALLKCSFMFFLVCSVICKRDITAGLIVNEFII